MGDTISLKNKNGEMQEAEVLLYFRLDEFNKNYVLYTFNDEDENELVTICASEVVENGDELEFNNIESDEEWNAIKNVMRDAIKKGQEG